MNPSPLSILKLAILGLIHAVLCLSTGMGQESVAVISFKKGESGHWEVQFKTKPDCYYILRKGDNPAPIALKEPKAMALRGSGEDTLTDPESTEGVTRAFYRIDEVSTSAPLDLDEDGMDDIYELRRALDPLVNDANLDPDGDGRTHLEEYETTIPTTFQTSPADTEVGVAITRETIIQFSNPLLESQVITEEEIYAKFGGEKTFCKDSHLR